MPNSRLPSPRVLAGPALLAALLSGCDSGLSIDATASGHPKYPSVVVNLSAIDFISDDIALSTLNLDVGAMDMAGYTDGERLSLVTEAELPADDYVGFRLQVDDASSYAVSSSGGQYPLISTNSGRFLDTEFSVEDTDTFEDGESLHRVVILDLRFSLGPGDDVSSLRFEPAARLVDPGAVGRIEGVATAALVEGPDCGANMGTTDSLAVYLFEGSDQTPIDFVAGRTGPIASSPVDWTEGQYRFVLRLLPAGHYTAALTCAGSAENPFADDSDTLGFVGQTNITVTADSSTEATIDG